MLKNKLIKEKGLEEVSKIYKFVSTTNKGIVIKTKLEKNTFSSLAVFDSFNNEIISSTRIHESKDVFAEIKEGEHFLEVIMLGEKDKEISMGISVSEHDYKVKNYFKNELNNYRFKGKIDNQKNKWYGGDFHTHTTLSDGKLNQEELLELAFQNNLNFYNITDHNVFLKDVVDSEDVLIINGSEITSSLGHFNLLFVKEQILELEDLSNINTEKRVKYIFEKSKNKAIRSISHPYLHPWEFKVNIDMDNVEALEIINDPTYKGNDIASDRAISAWNKALNSGYKIFGIGGSDAHNKKGECYPYSDIPSQIGDPTTFIKSNDLSLSSLYRGFIDGNIVVSRVGFIDLEVKSKKEGKKLIDNNFVAEVFLEDEYLIQWVVNSKVIKEVFSKRDSIEIELYNYSWVRVDIRKEGKLVGFTNPYFYGEKNRNKLYWSEL